MSSTVSSLTSNYTTTTSTTSTTSSNSALDFEDFINLLATELQYQDPSDPVSSTEYVAQMAQLSSLSQMENIYSAVNNSQAYDLIGKTVTYQVTDSDGNTTQSSGTVSAVALSSGTAYLVVNGSKVDMSSVVGVENASTDTANS